MSTTSINDVIEKFRPRLREYNDEYGWQTEDDMYLPTYSRRRLGHGHIFELFSHIDRRLRGVKLFSSRHVKRAHVIPGTSRARALGNPITSCGEAHG